MEKKKKTRKAKIKLVEIARSFSFKLNVGNYESRDFFCSQKAECPPQDAEKTSEALYSFCRSEVLKSVNDYIASLKKKDEPAAAAPIPLRVTPTAAFVRPHIKRANENIDRKNDAILSAGDIELPPPEQDDA